MSYNTDNYTEQGGARTVIGGSLDIVSGGDLDVESGAAFKLASVQQPVTISFAATAGAANICEVAITVKDGAGTAVARALPMTVWLSDAATGAGLTGTTASGTVQAKSASGADFGALTAKKALVVQTLATGIYTLEITDTSKTAFYVCASIGGITAVAAVLETADYG